MFGLYMGKTLFGGLTLLDEFNKRGGKDQSFRPKLFGEKPFESFVGGDGDDRWAESLDFSFGNGVDAVYARDLLANCKDSPKRNNKILTSIRQTANYAGDANNKPSAAYKNNQNKINDQVGVDASRRLQRLKAKQNVITNDCPKYDRGLNTKGVLTSVVKKNSVTGEYVFKCNGACNSSLSQFDYKLHVPKHGLYDRYYLKRGRSMLTEDELLRCKMKRTREEINDCDLLENDVERAACRNTDCNCPAVSTRIKV
jgi:hypothetical protein